MDVPVDSNPTKGIVIVNIYTYDTVGQTAEEEGSDIILRLERAILIVIYVASRPIDANKSIPREEMVTLIKLTAEAGLEEQHTIL